MEDRKVRRRTNANQPSTVSGDADESTSSAGSGTGSGKIESSSSGMSMTAKLATVLILAFVLANIIWIVIPVVFRSSATIQGMTVFMNYVNVHFLYNLSDPTQFGLYCARAFQIPSEDGQIRLSAWYIPPEEKRCQNGSDIDHLNDGRLVVLYAHGNSGTRGTRHRVALYRDLSNHLGVHVVTFDYRGFGDSSNVRPTANGIVNDARHVYRWILGQNVSHDRVVLWGHSLGTAVVSRLASELSREEYPLGVVLEAPFTDMGEATENFPLTVLFRFLPYFQYCFVQPIVENPETNFNTTAVMSQIRCPILILHAQDDGIVPYKMGEKLHQQAIQLQPNGVPRAQFASYPAELGYGHKKIYLDSGLPELLKNFFYSLQQLRQHEQNISNKTL